MIWLKKSLWSCQRSKELIALQLVLRCVGFRAAAHWFFGHSRTDPEGDDSVGAELFTDPKDIGRRVESLAELWLGQRSCLPKSLVIYRCLERRGLHPNLRIGVRKSKNGLVAHAWVELDNQSLESSTDLQNQLFAFERDPLKLVIKRRSP